MNAVPLVSILITNYNYGAYLEEAIASAFNQTYGQIELVVVDDGSTDSSLMLLERMRAESAVPFTVIQNDHGGAVRAFNTGISACAGEFVSYLHADDVMMAGRVLAQTELLASSEENVLCHSEYRCIGMDGEPLGFGSERDLPPAAGVALRELLLLRADVRSVTMAFRRDAIEQLDEEVSSEDWQLILRLAAKGQICHVPEPLVLRRVHGSNASLVLQGNLDPEFRFEDVALNVIRDVLPAALRLEDVVPIHAGTVLANALARGNWRKARDAYQLTVQEYPGLATRSTLLKAASRGLLGRAWKATLIILPDHLSSAATRFLAVVRGGARR